MRERVVTRAIITDNQSRVLLGRREHGQGKDQWALIGGKPDGEETPEETITREVGEELRARFKNPVFWKEIVDERSVVGETWHIYFYIGELEGKPDPLPEEITEIAWFEQQKIGELDIAFNHKEIIMEFFNNR